MMMRGKADVHRFHCQKPKQGTYTMPQSGHQAGRQRPFHPTHRSSPRHHQCASVRTPSRFGRTGRFAGTVERKRKILELARDARRRSETRLHLYFPGPRHWRVHPLRRLERYGLAHVDVTTASQSRNNDTFVPVMGTVKLSVGSRSAFVVADEIHTTVVVERPTGRSESNNSFVNATACSVTQSGGSIAAATSLKRARWISIPPNFKTKPDDAEMPPAWSGPPPVGIYETGIRLEAESPESHFRIRYPTRSLALISIEGQPTLVQPQADELMRRPPSPSGSFSCSSESVRRSRQRVSLFAEDPGRSEIVEVPSRGLCRGRTLPN